MSASGNAKGMAILVCLFVGLGVQGCRYTAISWGSKSEPDKIPLSTVTNSTTFPNRYVEFTDCVPLVEHAESVRGYCYVPLAPADAEPASPASDGKGGRPSGYSSRVIVKVANNKVSELASAITCRGLISGTCERGCHTTVRNSIPQRLGMQSIDAMPLLDFEQSPSMLMGVLMLGGSFAGLIFLCWMAMKSSSD